MKPFYTGLGEYTDIIGITDKKMETTTLYQGIYLLQSLNPTFFGPLTLRRKAGDLEKPFASLNSKI